MSLSVRIEVKKDDFTPTVREVLKQLGPANRTRMNRIAGRAALNGVRKYHADFNNAGRWSRRGGGASEFGADVVRGWGLAKADATGATLSNQAPHFAFKIEGGTIRPKRRQALTVPLVAEARGRFAEVYEQVTGRQLFRPKGTNILAEKTSDAKGFRAVYALVKSVTHKPTPGAMPPDRVFVQPYVQSILDQLRRALG